MTMVQVCRDWWNQMMRVLDTVAVRYIPYRQIRIAAVGVCSILTIRKILDYLRRWWYNYPPGPVGIPFFGTIFDFGSLYAKKAIYPLYGPIYMSHYGFSNVVFINDYNLLKHCFNREEFFDRKFYLSKKYELPFSEMRYNHEYLFRRKIMKENVISPYNSIEITNGMYNILNNHIFKILNKKIENGRNGNKNYGIWDSIRNECNYITFAAMYATSFGGENCPLPNDKRVIEYIYLNNKRFERLVMISALHYLFNQNFLLQKYIIKKYKYSQYSQRLNNIIKQWSKNVQIENKELYYNVLEKEYNNNSNNNNKNSNGAVIKRKKIDFVLNYNYDSIYEKIISDVRMTFGAGMHPTATALEQCILYLAQCGMELQNELFEEINKVLNINKLNIVITDNDESSNNAKYSNKFGNILTYRNKLVLLTSFIYEILRKHGIAALTLNRNIMKKDVTIEVPIANSNGNGSRKYVVPKGSIVWGNIAAINHNRKYWERELGGKDVSIFDPKRFLIKNKKTGERRVNHDTHLCTFGFGKRNCAGKELALKQLYLVLSMLIVKYTFTVPDSYDNENTIFKIPKLFARVSTPQLRVAIQHRA